MALFDTLFDINVNEHVEQKDTGKVKLSYLSWAWAWAEFKKRVPDAKYEVKTFENNLPYVYDPNTGYMVFTSVTAEGITHDMWLPVMDGQNKAMKSEPYQIKTKYNTITVQAATMFDINKTIMRCLVKNLGMFGLGLYIYAGEDLPENSEDTVKTASNNKNDNSPNPYADEVRNAQKELVRLIKFYGLDMTAFCKEHKVHQKSPVESFNAAIEFIHENHGYGD